MYVIALFGDCTKCRRAFDTVVMFYEQLKNPVLQRLVSAVNRDIISLHRYIFVVPIYCFNSHLYNYYFGELRRLQCGWPMKGGFHYFMPNRGTRLAQPRGWSTSAARESWAQWWRKFVSSVRRLSFEWWRSLVSHFWSPLHFVEFHDGSALFSAPANYQAAPGWNW